MSFNRNKAEDRQRVQQEMQTPPSQACGHRASPIPEPVRTEETTQRSTTISTPPQGAVSARAKFIELLKRLPSYMSCKLETLKAEHSQLERPDFIWHFLLQSFSTMGNSRGHQGLIGNRHNYNRVTFEAVSALIPPERLSRFEQVLLDAKVRMPRRKAEWLDRNHNLIVAMGGLETARRQALSQPGAKAKIQFMKQFAGIGNKYARNIWMDVYHPDFYDRIAIDERIKKISQVLGYSVSNYEAHEQFYLAIAREAGLQGWDLDRLLYNFTDYFLQGLT